MLRSLFIAIIFTSLALAQELPAGAFARLGGTALRHPERPVALAFRAGTAELASLGSDGTVRIWDTKTGKQSHLLSKKNQHANGMAFTASGKFLAVHFDDNHLWIYNAEKKYETHTFAKVPTADGLTITDDVRYAAGMFGGHPWAFDLTDPAATVALPEGSAVAIAPDGKSVAVAQKEKDEHFVEVLELPSGKRMLRMVRPGGDKANISSVAYAPDSRTLAMASDSSAPIVIFQLGKEEPLAKIEGSGPVAFTNAEKLIGRNDGRLSIWNTAGKLLSQNLGREVSTYTVSDDLKTAAIDSGGVIGSPRIRLWNVQTGKEFHCEKEFTFGSDLAGGLIGVTPHPKEGVIAITTDNPVDWRPGELNIYELGGIGKNKLVDDGFRQASSRDGKLTITVTNEEKPRLDVTSFAETALKIDLPTPALGIAVHPEGKSFAAITRDGFVRVWSADGKELWTTRVIRSLRAGIAYSPDGKTLAATTFMRVALFNAADGTDAGVISRQWEDGPFTSVCFNHDGSLIAAGTQGSSGSGVVYEFASRGMVKRYEGNCGSAIGVAFSEKRDVLVTAHSDDSLLAWKAIEPAKESSLDKLWKQLLEEDAAVAWPAMLALMNAKEKTVTAIAADFKRETKEPKELLRKQRAAVVLARIGTDEAKALLKP